MKQVTKTYSSLNQVAGIDQNKVKHLGKNYASIDFEIKEHVNPNDFKFAKMKPVVGTFCVGNKRVDVTFSELNQIMRTAGLAMDQCNMAYRMGKWGQATKQMGFHKRYIDDDQIIDMYKNQGYQAIIDWYTKGVDALILSGPLSERIGKLIRLYQVDKKNGIKRISELMTQASMEKKEI